MKDLVQQATMKGVSTMDTIIVILACLSLAVVSTLTAMSLWQGQTSQRGDMAVRVDVLKIVTVGAFLALATWMATGLAKALDNKELEQQYVCKQVYSMLGDHGYNWAPDRGNYLITDILGACTALTRAAWEKARRNGLLDGMVAMNRLDEALEAYGISTDERSDVTVTAYDLWKEAGKYKN